MNKKPVALRLDNLSKTFGAIQAVDRLSLDVHAGEMVGFLGPNGAGKSTTMLMITALVHPTAGAVYIFDYNVTRQFKKAMRLTGSMLDVPAFYDYLSGRRNLQLLARLRNNVVPDEIESVLRVVGLLKRAGDRVGAYSHGMKQRLGLAAALLGHPRLLLLDEPTNGMDPEATREVMSLLRSLAHNEGIAIFLSSHLLSEVEEYCDRVMVIHKGQLLASGKVQDILKPHEDIVRITFSDPIPAINDLLHHEFIDSIHQLSPNVFEFILSSCDSTWLIDYLVKNGFCISAVIPKRKTLKEFFLSITSEQDTNNYDDTETLEK